MPLTFIGRRAILAPWSVPLGRIEDSTQGSPCRAACLRSEISDPADHLLVESGRVMVDSQQIDQLIESGVRAVTVGRQRDFVVVADG